MEEKGRERGIWELSMCGCTLLIFPSLASVSVDDGSRRMLDGVERTKALYESCRCVTAAI